MALLLLSAFITGVLTVLVLEAVGIWILIRRLTRKLEREEIKSKAATSFSSSGDLNPSLYEKQGALWVLEPDKVPKSGLEDKVPTEQRRRKEILEVTPVRKYARIRDHYLILLESDGSCVQILLKGCTVVAVSGTSLASKKWAKKFPIKVESKDSLYKGCKIIYIYLETSWEKESWCKALRLASCDDEEKIAWFSKLSMEFHYYLASLNAGYPSFMKPSVGSNAELVDKSVKIDNSSSKVRQLLKKLTKKASKSAQDNKASGASVSRNEERKISLKSRSFQDLILDTGLTKMDTTGKPPKISYDDSSFASSMSTSSEPGTRSDLSRISDADSNCKYFDEGTLCLNVLLSRLFFDAKNNLQIRSSIQNRVQRALSNMRIPSYIGEVTCTSVDPGTLPPHILAMRVLPSDMNEMWALEIDVEYLGGAVLDIETRLEIRELESEEETRFDTNTAGEVTSDLLDGFEYLGKQLKLPEDTIHEMKQKDEGYREKDETENSRSTAHASPQGSRWKSILHSITKQVSQVPLSLGIRVSSLCGTIRLCMKPPPSDQIWFGFTSMPDIQFNLESFVGDHKVTNGHLALFLISRFKAAIRETLVLPNSESVGISWMLAEKDDWVPRSIAPFMWYKHNQDSASSTIKQEGSCFQPGDATHAVEPHHGNPPRLEVDREKLKNVGSVSQVTCESLDRCASSPSSMGESTLNDSSFQELRAPLIKKDKMQESGSRSIEEKPDTCVHSPSRVFGNGQVQNAEDDDTRTKRLGTRERMRGLGKKMGEKLEVKRRHFEEKGRSFVERIRGP
ncbi:Nucleus-vacuole junction protein 2 [Sesamum alatum]|uniref:Nucleus-vacuole junction protein 2 n=1 Tax=Sesamum alatum TaxID=300844 RepID=A0AAE1YDG6_9LAMI|nr:Nucleus-vacuole junction protein 2 [Sesamum alatum]